MNPTPCFHIERADYATQQALLYGVRHAVFVVEQQVPVELEIDALDPLSHHVLARADDGQVIGTARLTPGQRIGRMAVLAAARGHGVGQALLEALVAEARQRGWGEVSLHAQLTARDFYARNGFLPEGGIFEEAGIAHQQMRCRLDGAMRVDNLDRATAAASSVIHRARRHLFIQLRGDDSTLLGQPQVLAALRRFATARHAKQAQLLVHEADVTHLPASLVALVQRLPSVFQLREPVDPADCLVPSGGFCNDAGDCYFRPMGERLEGELSLASTSRARQQEALFQRIWERSRNCDAVRVLGV